MNTLSNSETKTEFSIHPATLIGHVSLTVANLENQITFYQQVLGFQLHWREGNKAGLGAPWGRGGGGPPASHRRAQRRRNISV